MERILILFSTGVKVLFNTCVYHSFIYSTCASYLGLKTKKLNSPISIETPLSRSINLTRYCTAIITLHRGCHMEDDFIVMDMGLDDLIP